MKFADVSEAILKDTFEDDLKKVRDSNKKLGNEAAQNILRKRLAYNSGVRQVIQRLTKNTGQWYVGSSQDALAEAIKKMPPEQYGALRGRVAGLVAKVRNVDKMIADVHREAKIIIDEIDREKG